jgi:hypothetical protein
MDIYWTGPFLVLLLIAVRYRHYFGYVILWVQFHYNRFQLLLKLVDTLNHAGTSNQSTPPILKIIDNDSMDAGAIVTYERLGHSYKLSVPYNRDKVVSMSQFRAILYDDASEEIEDITQEPGIPYQISARQLGGHTIHLINNENGQSYDYIEDTIPSYGDEIAFTE